MSTALAGPPAGTRTQPVLSLQGISKHFGAVRALDDVHLDVHAGEVVALVGDNGAGKSTLIKVIAGVAPADTGQAHFEGRPVTLGSPHACTELGIAVVYQDLALCDNLDVVANLFLGRESTANRVFLDSLTMERRARELLDSLAVRTLRSVRTPVGALSGGQRQTVAIARAMLGAPKVVLLDEPTAALGVAQTEQVLHLVRRLRERGVAVVLISHNLGDVFAVADRVEVLRLGRNAGTFDAHRRHHAAVVAAITGVGAEGLAPGGPAPATGEDAA